MCDFSSESDSDYEFENELFSYMSLSKIKEVKNAYIKNKSYGEFTSTKDFTPCFNLIFPYFYLPFCTHVTLITGIIKYLMYQLSLNFSPILCSCTLLIASWACPGNYLH